MHEAIFFLKDGHRSLKHFVVQCSKSYGDLPQPQKTFWGPSNTGKSNISLIFLKNIEYYEA